MLINLSKRVFLSKKVNSNMKNKLVVYFLVYNSFIEFDKADHFLGSPL